MAQREPFVSPPPSSSVSAFAAGWSPCIGPILAGILALAIATKRIATATGLLLRVLARSCGTVLCSRLRRCRNRSACSASIKRYLGAIEITAGAFLVATGIVLRHRNVHPHRRLVFYQYVNIPPSLMILWIVADRRLRSSTAWTKSLMHIASVCPVRACSIAIPHVLWWTFVQNTHGAFGLFGSQPVLADRHSRCSCSCSLHIAFRDAVRSSVIVRIAFGGIVGGAAGNILDRVVNHFVVDFIDFKTIWPNVFNLADSCITVGVALLIIASLRSERASSKSSP